MHEVDRNEKMGKIQNDYFPNKRPMYTNMHTFIYSAEITGR